MNQHSANAPAIVTIHGKQVQIIEYKGSTVVTLPMIDDLHERSQNVSAHAFIRNKKRLIENEDYFTVPYDEWNRIFDSKDFGLSYRDRPTGNVAPGYMPNMQPKKGGHRGSMHLLTQSGYLLLVKVFDDDLSWKIQRELVNCYFKKRTENSGDNFYSSNQTPAGKLIEANCLFMSQFQVAKSIGFKNQEAVSSANRTTLATTGYDIIQSIKTNGSFKEDNPKKRQSHGERDDSKPDNQYRMLFVMGRIVSHLRQTDPQTKTALRFAIKGLRSLDFNTLMERLIETGYVIKIDNPARSGGFLYVAGPESDKPFDPSSMHHPNDTKPNLPGILPRAK